MPTRRFAILEHTTHAGVHHDLLVDRPGSTDPIDAGGDADARTLWAARIQPPPADWLALGRLALTPLPPHRQLYLDYEGPIAGDRGSVRRITDGLAEITAWEPHRKALRLVLDGVSCSLVMVHDPEGGLIANLAAQA